MISTLTPRGWLQPLHEDWPTAVCRLLEDAPVVVRVVIAEVLGSAPREPGACMLITANTVEGTIGGGHLEWEAIEAARALLARDIESSSGGNTMSSAPAVQTQRLVLGPQLGQCCGGVVQVWYERFTENDLPFLKTLARAVGSGGEGFLLSKMDDGRITRRLVGAEEALMLSTADATLLRSVHDCNSPAGARPRPGPQRVDATSPEGRSRRLVRFAQTGSAVLLLERIDVPRPEVWIFGAGHVGQAVVRILAELPVRITWVDSRARLLPSHLPGNTRAVHIVDPIRALAEAPQGAHYLVMTHDHGVDYALCRAILGKGGFAWLGLIGSASKGARFRSRLRRDGTPDGVIASLTCPIGIDGIESKAPAAIAVGVAAQLLRMFDRPQPISRGRSARAAGLAATSSCGERDCSSCGVGHEHLS